MSTDEAATTQHTLSLRVAVISDIHAYEGIPLDKAPSHCCITDTESTSNPLVALGEFIKREQIKADVLLCPGDIGNEAQPVGIQHAWASLNELKAALDAGDLAITTGNHDVDSRHGYNEYDAKGFLQSLRPPYPLGDERLNDRYWSRHFVVVSRESYRLIILNSSAFHGEGRYEQLQRPEYEQGRISPHTLSAIKRELDATPAASVNILLCHHHPHPHSELRLGEDDLMIGGRELLDALGSGQYGPWLVLHGHKHHPKLEYAAGGSSSPVVFSAGSVAAVLYRELQTVSRNQFYTVEFALDELRRLGFVGRFQAWDWLSGHGWRRASRGSQLPALGGFGWRGDIALLAGRVSKAISSPWIRWTDLVLQVPELNYLLPKDLEQLVRNLRERYHLTVEPPEDAPPTLLGKET